MKQSLLIYLAQGEITMKYRIIMTGYDCTCPYKSQDKEKDKWYCIWKNLGFSTDLERAERKIKEHFDKRNEKSYTVGATVKEYTEADFLVQKLQDKY